MPSGHIVPMRLTEWMDRSTITDSELAARLEEILRSKVDRSTVSRIRRGKRMPSPEMMRAIREATFGAVTANDFVHAEDVAA